MSKFQEFINQHKPKNFQQQDVDDRENDTKIINIQLDDVTILSTDKYGDETTKLGITIKDKTLTVYFPKWDQWDDYVKDLSHLFLTLAEYAPNVEMVQLFDEDFNTEKFQLWSVLMSQSMQIKKVRKICEKIFVKYLNPTIEGIDKKYLLNYCKRTLGFDQLFRLFIAILFPDQWIKKNATHLAKKLYPQLAPQLSSHPSLRNTELEQTNLPENQLSISDTF